MRRLITAVATLAVLVLGAGAGTSGYYLLFRPLEAHLQARAKETVLNGLLFVFLF